MKATTGKQRAVIRRVTKRAMAQGVNPYDTASAFGAMLPRTFGVGAFTWTVAGYTNGHERNR